MKEEAERPQKAACFTYYVNVCVGVYNLKIRHPYAHSYCTDKRPISVSPSEQDSFFPSSFSLSRVNGLPDANLHVVL